MVNEETKFVVLDLETSGIEPEGGQILEVAIQTVDSRLEPIDQFSTHIWPTFENVSLTNSEYVVEYFKGLGEVVKDMHTENGLFSDILDTIMVLRGFYTVDAVEKTILSWLDDNGLESNVYPLMGSSVHFDRAWMKKFMPSLEAWFTYRNIDISSIKELLRGLGFERYRPNGAVAHRALADTDATLAEARYYLENYFDLEALSA